jgi:hypothetical protein
MLKQKNGGFRSILRTIPTGDFILALWDWKGGVAGKLFIILIAFIGLIIYSRFKDKEPSHTNSFNGNSNAINAPITQANQSSNVVVKHDSDNSTQSVGSNNSGPIAQANGNSNTVILNPTTVSGVSIYGGNNIIGGSGNTQSNIFNFTLVETNSGGSIEATINGDWVSQTKNDDGKYSTLFRVNIIASQPVRNISFIALGDGVESVQVDSTSGMTTLRHVSGDGGNVFAYRRIGTIDPDDYNVVITSTNAGPIRLQIRKE